MVAVMVVMLMLHGRFMRVSAGGRGRPRVRARVRMRNVLLLQMWQRPALTLHLRHVSGAPVVELRCRGPAARVH